MNAPAVAQSAAASHAVAPAPTVTLAAPSALQSTSAPAAIGSFAAAPSMLAQQVGPSIRILEAGETMNAPAVAQSAAASHAVAPAPTVTLAAPSALQSTSAPAAIGSFAAAPSMLAQQVGQSSHAPAPVVTLPASSCAVASNLVASQSVPFGGPAAASSPLGFTHNAKPLTSATGIAAKLNTPNPDLMRNAVTQTAAGVTETRNQYFNQRAMYNEIKFNGDFTINGSPLTLQLEDREKSSLETGLTVWDGGIVLAKYFESIYPPNRLGGRKLRGLEFGAGTGVSGLALAMLGHNVVLTDLGVKQRAISNACIRHNEAKIAAAGGSATYEEIDWMKLPSRESFGEFDVVFAADVLYSTYLVELFGKALSWAASGPGFKDFFLAHRIRDEACVARWEEVLSAQGYSFTVVESEDALGKQYGHSCVVIYHAKKR